MNLAFITTVKHVSSMLYNCLALFWFCYLVYSFDFQSRACLCGSANPLTACRGGGGQMMSEMVYILIGLAGKKIIGKGAMRKVVAL